MFNNSTPLVMPVAPATVGYGSGSGMGGFADGGWLWIIVVFALLFGWGNNGWGGNGNGGNNFVPYAVNNSYTDAAIQRGFDNQAVISKLDGITQGICDSAYALNNSLMTGFHGVDNAVCTLGYQTQSGFNALGAQLAQCCCDTQRAIDGVNYNMATQACDTRNTIQNTTRDIIDNQNCNTRQILDFLVNDKIATLTAENQSLKFAASQSDQNAVLRAAMDANTATLIRRLGAECPQAAYVVQPPQPVTFPVNGCGNFVGYNSYGNGCGYGNAFAGNFA